MGCDIHVYVEKLNEEGDWVSADTWEEESDPEEAGVMFVPYKKALYSERNYPLFGFLTKGIVRVDVPNPMELKGFPEDASQEVQDVYMEWGGDAHTPNYFTLEELVRKQVELVLLPTHGYVADALNDIIRALTEKAEGSPPAQSRIVFWFDN